MKGPYSSYIKSELQKLIKLYQPDTLISGLALGVDTIFALLAIENNLNLVAAIPCIGQEKKWTESSKKLYNDILHYDKCTQIIVSDGSYKPAFMQIRNEYMVNHADKIIAVWDGTSGGTNNCIKYAKKISKPIDYIKINHEYIRSLEWKN